MTDNLGADPALAKAEPVARLGPSGFDPGEFVTGARAATLWPDRESELYWPSFPGVHICGANHEDNYFYTIANFPTANDDEAEALWAAMKAECEVHPDEADFVVDLNTSADMHIDDFWSNSQMLARIAEIARIETRKGGDAKQGSVEDESRNQLQGKPA